MVSNKGKSVLLSIVILLPTSFCIFIYLNGVDLFFENDGIVDPSIEYQRTRRSEYDLNKPFFQWWYFAIKDLENNEYFTFHYNIVDTPGESQNNGTYVSFSYVNNQNNWHKYEKYPYESFIEHQAYDVEIDFNNEIDFGFNISKNGDYHVWGEMNNYEQVWKSLNCSKDTYVKWNLDISRIYGWYGQDDSRWVYETFGIINWNTYSHCSQVNGTIQINSTIYTITKTENFRAYCDENWGENFPSGSPSIEFPWGWYYAGLPNADINQELSIIAGIGYHDTGFPFGKCLGQFADIRMNSSERIGVRQNDIWGEDISYSFMETSNDIDTIKFDVERSNWQNFTDQLGTALIPLHQKVKIETYNYIVELDFQSELSDYNRLLFPHSNNIFSDFEGLGVNCHVKIIKRDVKFPWWDFSRNHPISSNEETIYDFYTDDAGIEYGYNLE